MEETSKIIINNVSLKDENSKLDSCVYIFDLLWYCPSPRNQINHYYREGEIMNCGPILSDWLTCMKSKLYSNVHEREVRN